MLVYQRVSPNPDEPTSIRKALDDVPPDVIFIVMAFVCLLLIGIIADTVRENYASLEPGVSSSQYHWVDERG
jgi:hypothetical protein